MRRAIMVSKIGDGVGISRYQYHHSRAVRRIKMEGAMIKGRMSLSINLLSFWWMYWRHFIKKLFVRVGCFLGLDLIIFRRNFGISIIVLNCWNIIEMRFNIWIARRDSYRYRRLKIYSRRTCLGIFSENAANHSIFLDISSHPQANDKKDAASLSTAMGKEACITVWNVIFN